MNGINSREKLFNDERKRIFQWLSMQFHGPFTGISSWEPENCNNSHKKRTKRGFCVVCFAYGRRNWRTDINFMFRLLLLPRKAKKLLNWMRRTCEQLLERRNINYLPEGIKDAQSLRLNEPDAVLITQKKGLESQSMRIASFDDAWCSAEWLSILLHSWPPKCDPKKFHRLVDWLEDGCWEFPLPSYPRKSTPSHINENLFLQSA